MGSIFNVLSIDRTQVHWEDYIYQLTPVEHIGGIWWKREDKFAPLGPGKINGSKLRQLIWLFSQQQNSGVASGAVTASPQLLMVAACAKHWSIACVQFTGGRGEMVTAGEKFGAETRVKSWHRPNRRYPGVYLDMLHDRIKKAEAAWPEEDFGLFWEARKIYLPAYLRLEDNPGDVGVRPEKQNHYRLTGQVINLHKDWACFQNDYNDQRSV
jgi:hypothetical protein